jgi:selenocysteine lyase/cysteine desulfurase
MTNERYSQFLKKYPGFESTNIIDELRTSEFSRIDRQHQVYLDYTGGGLYSESQVRLHQQMLLDGVFGNPHSSNPTSSLSTEWVEKTRKEILKFFNASPEEYVVIFTPNASGALKLVGESYPFEKGCCYLLTYDNHNSVNGIREFAQAKGTNVRYIPVFPPEMRINEKKLEEYLPLSGEGCNNLFAYPAQSNFSSVQHPLEWIEKAHDAGWDVLLDVAAFAPTNRLDLSLWKPDFIPISFYKMFGYPTGIGALIARREALVKLRRPWFAGGTITVASVQGKRHYLADAPAAFEDGTLNYLSIPAVCLGLEFMDRIGMECIHQRVQCLTGWMLSSLLELKHKSGLPLVKIYGPIDSKMRGGAVALNFFDPHGQVIDHKWIDEMATRENISLRTGCFCNPGAGEVALEISPSELTSCFARPDHEQHLTYDEFRLCINNKASGAVRISVGTISNFADVEKFIDFSVSLVK